MLDGTGAGRGRPLLAHRPAALAPTTSRRRARSRRRRCRSPGQPNFMTRGAARALQGAGDHGRDVLPGRHLPDRRGAADRRRRVGRALHDEHYAHTGPYSTPCVVPSALAGELHQPDDKPGHADLALRHARADGQLDVLRDRLHGQQLRRHVRRAVRPNVGLRPRHDLPDQRRRRRPRRARGRRRRAASRSAPTASTWSSTRTSSTPSRPTARSAWCRTPGASSSRN